MITHHTVSEAQADSRPRILVADDNQANQKVAAAMLVKIGFRADFVSNGVEAVDACSRWPYGAILMDCQMPGMDGYEATRQIRAREGDSSRIPIIAMTAGASKGEKEKCLEAGMDDYISKPFMFEDLRLVLRHWVEDKALQPSSSEKVEAPATSLHVIDRARVEELRGIQDKDGVDAFAILTEIFLRDTPEILADLRIAVEANDLTKLGRLTHKLKGAAGTLGASRLMDVCSKLEDLTREGHRLSGGALTTIESEYRLVEQILRVKPE